MHLLVIPTVQENSVRTSKCCSRSAKPQSKATKCWVTSIHLRILGKSCAADDDDDDDDEDDDGDDGDDDDDDDDDAGDGNDGDDE